MIDDSLSRRIIVYAAMSGAIGVAIGAYGAHGLESFLISREQSGDESPEGSRERGPELIAKRLDQFDVGVRYHLVHSVALLALASVPFGSPASRHWVSRFFLAGLLLFSGSLYALVLSDTPWLGAITPIGGLAWILGWLTLVLVARRTSTA